ncbi:hypothetical protein Arnit_2313 [Arcobacter nitrofigilis DSM 7299]|uniref:Beta-ketoacyl synthase N-terminal domain-containing protein n=1 Tax=Arcobacter nitrofigilis (strain ATCC 33309 / DSM 7299 / CCUG 15893 / LMG 7604 / NCTC 12251 / CI) TaxID=572480 RepID=D5V102_ARCNC|nr:hypothetical protein [Arcobacter nitrofigilis]ADG93964.1 hypothetical protein Arnit_2313 [Arcobacter nitrofigilis DSM 7299]
MYIKSIYKQVNENKSAKEYRKDLKEISSLNFRRNSKLNVMAVYGALKALENIKYKDNLSIYLASEYGCIEDLLKVLNQINSKESFVMPFDFLNVNTNNTGFLISQALQTIGNNINVSSEDLSFEKAFELAYFDFHFKKVDEILVGGVDESLDNVSNHNSFINNLDNLDSKDGSSWLYINNDKTNSLTEIKHFEFFTNLEELNKYLKTIDYKIVGLNQFAKKYVSELQIDKNLIYKSKNNFCGTYSVPDIIDLLKEKEESSVYISLDSKKRAYLFFFKCD